MKRIFLFFACILVFAGCSSLDQNIPTATTGASPVNLVTNTPTVTTSPATDPNSGPETGDSELIGIAVQHSCQKNAPCLVDGESYPDGSQLVLVPASGEAPAAVYLSALGDVVHIASPVDFSHPEETVFIFRAYEDNQFEIVKNGEVIRSFDGINISHLVGAPMQQVFALSYIPGVTGRDGTDSGLSEIMVSPGVGPMVAAPGPEWLLVPIAVHGNNQPPPNDSYVDLWYTYEPYGIGGEIIFPPYRGLYYLLGNAEDHQEVLSQDLQFSALSPNNSLVAYTQSPYGEIIIRSLQKGSDADIHIPLLAGIEKGAGSAAFSPDSANIAWLEANGSLFDGDFESVIRIATVSGNILAEFSAADLQQAAGFTNVIIRPVGWLNNQRVLLQVYVTRDYGEKFLLIANTDGTIEETKIMGTFIEMIYADQ